MRENKTVTLAAAVATAGIWVAVYFSMCGPGPPLDGRPHEALGWMMARQAVSLLKGGQITVIARDTSAFQNPASDIQLAAFKKALRKSGLTIGSLHLLEVDPLRPVEVPPGDFQLLIRQSPPGSVIVSFMGPPGLTGGETGARTGAQPAIVALCSGNVSGQVDLQALFQQGLLQVAILDRRDAGLSKGSRADLKACFDERFVTVTAQDTASLPSATGSEP